MLLYYINGENWYHIRTEFINNYTEGLFYMNLENMDNGYSQDFLLSGETFSSYQQELDFTIYLPNVKEGEQYRCVLYYGNSSKWRGSLSVYSQDYQNDDKKDYETKLNNIIIDNSNDYIVLEN